MNQLFTLFTFILITGLSSLQSYPRSIDKEVAQCKISAHCYTYEIVVNDPNKELKKAEAIIRQFPRSKIVEETKDYLHVEATTKWMHFIDDLELKALPDKRILIVKSESRVGLSDMGVNKKRVKNLLSKLDINIKQ